MEKPISLRLKEFKESAINLVNNSGLALIVVEPVLKDILGAVQSKLEQEYIQDKINYEKSLQQNEGDDKND